MAARRVSTEQALALIVEASSEEDMFVDSDSEAESEHGGDSGSEFAVSEHSSSSDEGAGADEALDERVPVPRARPAQAGQAQVPPVGVADAAQAGRRGRRVRIGRSVPSFVDPSWVAPNLVQPVLPHFTGTPGCTVDTTNFAPIDYFQLFVDEQLLMEMVEQTNIYAAAYLRDHVTTMGPKSRAHRWSPTNIPELRKFWGLSILMGIVQKPTLSSYWAGNPSLLTSIFPAIMSRDRFLLLQSMLHFNDNAAALPRAHPDHDRLFKLRPVLDHFASKFATVYVPDQHISVDESLVLFKGRLLFKQYIPSKRSRYGIKLYMLSESNTGYAYSFRVYTGKDSTINPLGCPDTLSITEKIVWDLTNSLFNMGYHLYLDNFYTGITLFKELYAKETVACGTIRSSRKGLPKQLVLKKLERGQCSALRSEQLLFLKFHDRRDVYVLSTIHDESTQPVTVWGQVAEVHKPTCILQYNKYMGGVDKTDQLMEPYNAPRKCRKWYKKLVAHMMHLAMLNAFVVYSKCTTEKKMSLLQFELAVVHSLMAVETVVPVVTGVEDVDRLTGCHFFDFIPPTQMKDSPCKRCRVCTRKKIRRETRYFCPSCPSKPGLCIPTCFRLYHTKANYWDG